MSLPSAASVRQPAFAVTRRAGQPWPQPGRISAAEQPHALAPQRYPQFEYSGCWLVWGRVVSAGDGGGKGRNVTPLSGAERVRRHRERKKAEAAAAGRPFEPGHELSLVHGAYSEERVLARRAEIERVLLADPSTPDYLKSDGSYRPALRALCRAEAVVSMLEEWLDQQDIRSALTELTTGEESEDRPAPMSVRRTSVSRRVASALDALHKHEVRAMNLRARLGLDPLSRARLGADLAQTADAAAVWAQMWERKQGGKAAGDGSV